MKKITLIFFLIFLYSCRDSKEIEQKVNKFLVNNKIDSINYHTLDELSSNNKINKVILTKTPEDLIYNHIERPIILKNRYLIIEKGIDALRNIIVKYDEMGNPIDSIIVNKNSIIVNDYIIEKKSYLTWLFDGNKTNHHLENKNYFSKADSTKIKELVNNVSLNKIPYYTTEDYDSNPFVKIDTCNYLILFKNDKLIKFNYSKNIRPNYELKLENILPEFSNEITTISSLKPNKFLKIDNYFATVKNIYIRGNKIHFSLTSTGTGGLHSDHYSGTLFFSVNSKLKVKMKTNITDDELKQDINDYEIYTEDFLKYYIIKNIREKNIFYFIKK